METMRIGCPVYTSDGDKLGTVKDLAGDTFKLDVSGQPDYWLRSTDVLNAAVDRITMRFNKDHLGDYKTEQPAVRSV